MSSSCLSKCLSFILLLSGLSISGCLMETDDGIDDKDLSVASQEVSYNGHDYLFVTTPQAWHQAQTYCFNYGGGAGYHLVTINDAAEESFLNSSEVGRGMSRWWIGYSDEGIEGSWIWSNGFSSHINWTPGNPDNASNQDCAVDRFDGNDGWDDQNCGWHNVFICERDSDATGNRGSFSYASSNTSSATTNVTQYSVFLFAGQLFTVGTCGVPGASGSGDTYLRIKNPSGVEVGKNDDSSGCGLLSNFSIIASTTGTHAIHAGCFSSNSCSGTVAFNY